jgi:hypothetical protein
VSPHDVNSAPTASGLRQVLYISRAAGTVTDTEVKKILFASQRNNRRKDVTGCLLFTGSHFVQVLEGDGAALSSLLAYIATDPRHTNVQVIVDQRVTRRRCPDWSMGLLYKLDIADRIETLLAGAACSRDVAFELLCEVSPDSVLGGL